MSMDRCARCDAVVDTDFDLDCYIETKYGDICRCESCRSRQEIEDERYEAAQGEHETEAGV